MMTTARERYEAKTRVVTFRVSNEIFEQLEEVKSKSGLSNADLIKLGAKIAQEELKGKLAAASGLEARLAELRSALDEEHGRLKESIGSERKRKLEELDLEMAAFKLFDRRWSTEQVRFKLGLLREVTFRYLQEWGDIRKDQRTVDRELLKECLKRHITKLRDDLSWARIWPSTPEERKEELERLIGDCQRMLVAPSKITKADREFLLAEYSDMALSAMSRKKTG